MEFCPQCRTEGQVRKLVCLYFSETEAFTTCENNQCVYFVTDDQGNPIKFKHDSKLQRLCPTKVPAQVDNSPPRIEERMLPPPVDNGVPSLGNKNVLLPNINLNNEPQDNSLFDDDIFNKYFDDFCLGSV